MFNPNVVEDYLPQPLPPHPSQLFFTVEIFRAATESRVDCGFSTEKWQMTWTYAISVAAVAMKPHLKSRKSWQEPWKYEILVGEMQDPWSLACFFTPFYALPGIPIWTSEIFSESPISKPEGWSDEHHTFLIWVPKVFFLLKDWGYFSKVTNFQFCGAILPICPR